MRTIRNCRGYGSTYMAPCKANHPAENSKVMLGISVDGIELHFITGDKRTGEVRALLFEFSSSADCDASSVGFQEEVEKFAWEKIKRWKYSEPEKTFSFQYCFSSVKEKWIICDTIQVGTFCRSQNLFFFERSHLLIIILKNV